MTTDPMMFGFSDRKARGLFTGEDVRKARKIINDEAIDREVEEAQSFPTLIENLSNSNDTPPDLNPSTTTTTA